MSYEYVPVSVKAHADWNGDIKAVGSYDIDTSAWGIPAGVKAIVVRLIARWGSAGGDYYVCCQKKGTYEAQVAVYAAVGGRYEDTAGIVNCDANGDIRVIVGGQNTTATYLQIFGYFL